MVATLWQPFGCCQRFPPERSLALAGHGALAVRCSPRGAQPHRSHSAASRGGAARGAQPRSREDHSASVTSRPRSARGGCQSTARSASRRPNSGSGCRPRRLLGVAETTREMARSAFHRAGMQEGWHAIDCGCGPIGGLAVMAEMVGPAGRVVGVDFSEPAIQRARSVVAALHLGNVELFAGDIHELDARARRQMIFVPRRAAATSRCQCRSSWT